ncbi:GNAT family N-acetyltransferase [Holdemanella biformis]|uniref:GNAT family N-acetyltransferase n=1 Tax=Holdemanella biformis TaxID=1735 RepID=UPI0022E4469E|nr:GNAT family N-acetyltransferase [Holdemanella biformis]
MTVLDTSIPYEKVLMIMARKTIRKEIELNPKFHYVEFDESLKEAWCKLQTQVCLFENIDEARKKWDSMLTRDKDFFSKHFLFVVNENNELVGSAGLWFGNDFEESRLRVHYVAVSLSAQHKKIAQAMLTKLCMMYDMIPSKYPLYLATQSQSYGAIKLYSRLGFTPYLGAYKGCTEQKSKNAWQNVTEILRCKA